MPRVSVSFSPAACPDPPAGAQAVSKCLAATASGTAANFRMRCITTPLLDSLGRREPTRPVTDAVVALLEDTMSAAAHAAIDASVFCATYVAVRKLRRPVRNRPAFRP